MADDSLHADSVYSSRNWERNFPLNHNFLSRLRRWPKEPDPLFTVVTAVTLVPTRPSAHLVAPGQKQNLGVWVFGGGRHLDHDGLHHDRHAVGEVLGGVTFKCTGGKRKNTFGCAVDGYKTHTTGNDRAKKTPPPQTGGWVGLSDWHQYKRKLTTPTLVLTQSSEIPL